MKSIRTLTLGLALVASVPAAATAQSGRNFENSWFWGAKGGAMTFWTTRVKHQPAPLVGAEWLITRRRAALNVSLEQAFFDEKSTVFDPSAVDQQRTVQIKDLRRLSMTLLAFPGSIAGHQFGSFRPYGGVGFSLLGIQKTTPEGVASGTPQADTLNARILDVKSAMAPHLMIGAQTGYRRVTLFGQASGMWAQKRFLFNDRPTYVIEGGVRINLGSAIERPN